MEQKFMKVTAFGLYLCELSTDGTCYVILREVRKREEVLRFLVKIGDFNGFDVCDTAPRATIDRIYQCCASFNTLRCMYLRRVISLPRLCKELSLAFTRYFDFSAFMVNLQDGSVRDLYTFVS